MAKDPDDVAYEVLRLPDVFYDLGWFDPCNPWGKLTRFNGPFFKLGAVTYMAMSDAQALGMLVIERPEHHQGTIRECGALVRPAYRRLGISKQLWRVCLENEKPKAIRVRVVTDKGHMMMESVRASYPNYKWIIEACGNRQPRTLRKR